ncbi:MAG: ATP-binding cassette domain-containing protein [Clostridia bacterium]|nr:ATP-binding cassette domain-containing protein [Clostridia bacterium]
MATPLLEVKHLTKFYKTHAGTLHAVDDVSLSLEAGKTLGVVGESGCGKSTLGRTILHLVEPTSGQIFFDGKDISRMDAATFKESRKWMQIIFQDPYASLNPRMTVEDTIEEPLRIFGIMKDSAERSRYVESLMDSVGLARRLKRSYPHELDGGRRQRIGVARALALKPKFIVCDEPVSALDVSIQAQILNLMQDLQQEQKLTYLFITHDLSVVRHISDEIVVMYLGQAVERAPANELFEHTLHPYTKALLSAIPIPKPHAAENRIVLKGELTSPIDPKPGCRFAPRCPMARPECYKATPELRTVAEGHSVACFFAQEAST